MSEEEHICKVVLVGETQTGKTSIIAKLIQNEFKEDVPSTLVNSISKYEITIKKKPIQFLIWDTAGQEKYRSLNTLFYKDAIMVVIVYDITQRRSFNELKNYWIEQIHQNCEKNVILALAANKADLIEKQTITEDEGKELARSINAIFMMTSCLSGTGIRELFEEMGKAYFDGGYKGKDREMKLEKKGAVPNKRGCCHK